MAKVYNIEGEPGPAWPKISHVHLSPHQSVWRTPLWISTFGNILIQDVLVSSLVYQKNCRHAYNSCDWNRGSRSLHYKTCNFLCLTCMTCLSACHVTPFLHKLHWLPIHYRILFKYNLLIYKAIHFSQPPYLSALIRRSDLTRGNRLSISSSKPNKRSGLRSFIAGAHTEWNKLPQAIRTIESISGFRKQLKTYLFRLAYPPP